MHRIFDLRQVIQAAGVLSILAFMLLSLVPWPESWVARINTSALVAGGVIVVIGAKWGAWRRLWRRFDALNTIVYPDLNGVWVGDLRSNWPVIERMAKAAKGEVASFDPFGSANGDATELQAVPIILRIEADWFTISAVMERDTRYSDSETIAVNPIRAVGGGAHRLSYVFRNRTPDPLPTDCSHHLGAALLDVVWGASPRLEGTVWTERNWRKGMNTAGLLSLTRVSADPKASVPGGGAPTPKR